MDKQEMSFEIGSRLKSLREEKHLSYQGLADALLKKYGIKISKDSLRDYEICSDYRSKAKSLPNLGMRTEYLIALSDFYEVSTDYLLCKTDVRSQDIQVREICRYTGLSENTIELLHFGKSDLDFSGIKEFFDFLMSLPAVTIFEDCLQKAALSLIAYKRVPPEEGGGLDLDELRELPYDDYRNKMQEYSSAGEKRESQMMEDLLKGNCMKIGFEDAIGFFTTRAVCVLEGVTGACVDNIANKLVE